MPAKTEPTSGWIYFIACPDLRAIKIGWTADKVIHRVRACKTYCPALVELTAAMVAEPGDEDVLHDILDDLNIHGEWFRDDPRIWEGIAREADDRPDEVVGRFVEWRRAAERDRPWMERTIATRAAYFARLEAARIPSSPPRLGRQLELSFAPPAPSP